MDSTESSLGWSRSRGQGNVTMSLRARVRRLAGKLSAYRGRVRESRSDLADGSYPPDKDMPPIPPDRPRPPERKRTE